MKWSKKSLLIELLSTQEVTNIDMFLLALYNLVPALAELGLAQPQLVLLQPDLTFSVEL